MWLVAVVTGDLADALDRDLRVDRLTFDELGWRGLYAYVVEAPSGTAMFHHRTQGLTLGDELILEVLNELRAIHWRYTAVNFQGGKDNPLPQRFTRTDVTAPSETIEPSAYTWETATLDQLVSPEVRALLQGG